MHRVLRFGCQPYYEWQLSDEEKEELVRREESRHQQGGLHLRINETIHGFHSHLCVARLNVGW